MKRRDSGGVAPPHYCRSIHAWIPYAGDDPSFAYFLFLAALEVWYARTGVGPRGHYFDPMPAKEDPPPDFVDAVRARAAAKR